MSPPEVNTGKLNVQCKRHKVPPLPGEGGGTFHIHFKRFEFSKFKVPPETQSTIFFYIFTCVILHVQVTFGPLPVPWELGLGEQLENC